MALGNLFVLFATIVVCIQARTIRMYGEVTKTVTLPCSLQGTDGSRVYWRSDDYLNVEREIRNTVEPELAARLAVTGSNRTFNLEISQLQLTDAGQYSCQIYKAANGTSQYFSTVDYELVIFAPPSDLYPECNITRSFGRTAGDSVSISCLSRGGSPEAELSWYAGERVLNSTKDPIQNLLTINKTLEKNDNGVVYTCRSMSPVFATPRTCSVTLLSILPSVSLSSNKNTVSENDDVIFTCSGKGIPSISYQWFLNNETLEESNRFVLNSGAQELHVLRVLSADNNTMVTCQVSTPTGLTSARRKMLFVSRYDDSCIYGKDGPQSRGNSSEISVIPILIAFVGGVGLTLLVVFTVVVIWKQYKRHVRREKQASQANFLWSSKRETVSGERTSGDGTRTKEPVFITASNVAKTQQMSRQLNQAQKNQYFEMHCGTVQSFSVATNETLQLAVDHPFQRDGFDYENIARDSSTNETEVWHGDASNGYRRNTLSTEEVYMEPKVPSVPKLNSIGRSDSLPYPNNRQKMCSSLVSGYQRGVQENSEYTEIDALPSPTIRNTYEMSIISTFNQRHTEE